MASKTVEMQAKNFLSDLNNAAHEYGFEAAGWEFRLANAAEKKTIENKYYPMVFTEILPENLFDFYNLLQVKYAEAKSDVAWKMDNKNIAKSPAFFCAFNPDRLS